MKRDLDLVREILRFIEEYDGDIPKLGICVEIEGHSKSKVDYHLNMMHQAGLLDGQRVNPSRYAGSVNVFGLTWDGHEFLDTARDDARWEKAKEIGAALGFDVLRNLLSKAAFAAAELIS